MNLDDVRPLQGTRSHFAFSYGNCLPLVARPWGMAHWSLQTDEGPWLFNYDAQQLQGIRCTHQPSPWMGDYGHLALFPCPVDAPIAATERASAYRRHEATIRPDRLCAALVRYAITFELVPSARGALLRCTFPAGTAPALLLQPFAGESGVTITPLGEVRLFTRANNGGVQPDFACYYDIVADTALDGWQIVHGTQAGAQEPMAAGERVGVKLLFAATDSAQTITFQIAQSFISAEQATVTRRRELSGSFDVLHSDATSAWQTLLDRVTIAGATAAQQQTFATCLYRSLLFPRALHEIDAADQVIHACPYGGGIRPGVLYTDNGFWDTFRTVYPLLALLYPAQLAEIMEGWTNAAGAGGWLPTWASPGYRSCMIGTHLDAIIADAYLRGVTGFAIERAYAAALRDCTYEGEPHGLYGRRGQEAFIALGYVPADQFDHAAARTQEYAYTDWAVAQLARALGKDSDAAQLEPRGQHYRNTFDAEVGFMRGRRADGSWLAFDPLAWDTDAYVEGGAWQYSWQVPHDIPGLIEVMGGAEAFVAKLDTMLDLPPQFGVGGYGFEIHEMTEMAVADFGQYAHSNQPVHHVLYLYSYAGRPDRTQALVRRVLDELYSAEADGLPGDEDNGEMSAWYILSALGLYPVCPGKPTFTLGSPLFARATITLENGAMLTIDAPGNSPTSGLVQDVLWQGQLIAAAEIAHSLLAGGGTLTFQMQPNG